MILGGISVGDLFTELDSSKLRSLELENACNFGGPIELPNPFPVFYLEGPFAGSFPFLLLARWDDGMFD